MPCILCEQRETERERGREGGGGRPLGIAKIPPSAWPVYTRR